jgi:hypothetical protein
MIFSFLCGDDMDKLNDGGYVGCCYLRGYSMNKDVLFGHNSFGTYKKIIKIPLVKERMIKLFTVQLNKVARQDD